MNVADIVILSVIGISALMSLIRGLVKEVLSLLAWVVAFWLAFSFSSPLGERLSGVITQAPARIAIALPSPVQVWAEVHEKYALP